MRELRHRFPDADARTQFLKRNDVRATELAMMREEAGDDAGADGPVPAGDQLRLRRRTAVAELIRDAEVRQAVRRELCEVCTTGAGQLMTSSPMLDALEAGAAIGQAVMDAARERVAPDSPRGREIADRWIGWLTGIFATPDKPRDAGQPEFRIQAADHMLAGAEWDRTPPEPEGPFDRYMALVTAVNNAPPERIPFEWLAAALRASALPVPDQR